MALRRSRQKSPKKSSRRLLSRRSLQRRDTRDPRLEALEDRRVMTVGAGPELVAVQANDGTLIRDGSIQHVAPRDLTFRFDDGQIIDAASLAAIEITRTVGNQ